MNEFEIKNLYVTYVGLTFSYNFIQRFIKSKVICRFGFLDCIFYGINVEHTLPIITKIAAFNCKFANCKIAFIYSSPYIPIKNGITKKTKVERIIPESYLPDNSFRYNTFYECDFSNCTSWINACVPVKKVKKHGVLDKCFYYSNCEPQSFNEDDHGKLLIRIDSEQQFRKIFGDMPFMQYSPPKDKK